MHVYSDSIPSKRTTVQVQIKHQMATKGKNSKQHHVTVSMASLRCPRTALATSVYAKMACSTEPLVKSFTKFLNTSDMHSASGCASQTLRKPRSRVGAHSSNFDSIQKKRGCSEFYDSHMRKRLQSVHDTIRAGT